MMKLVRLDLSVTAALFLAAFGAGQLRGQDPFEIHVYEYGELKRGQASFETHLNYYGWNDHQTHLTGELTVATSDHTALGFMILSGHRPGHGNLDYAGWRILPHVYAPESWHLPVKLGLVTEFSFQKTSYEENPLRVEVRPIIQKDFGEFRTIFNPVFSRALHGPDTRTGWHFEPSARLAFRPEAKLSPNVDYYSAWGQIGDLSPLQEQFHQIMPGVDIKLHRRLLCSVGVGAGLTSVGNRLVYKSRLELLLGRLE